MRTFKVDGNNDLTVENGNLVIAKGEEAVMISCEQAAKAQHGEMIFNIQGGVPYKTLAWSGAPNLSQLEHYIRREIMKVSEVVGISDFSMSINEDILSYSATINTTYGTVTLDGLRISK